MSTRQNAIWNVGYRVFSILLPLVTAPYLSRVVGQSGVGIYSYAWSISEIFVILGMLGLSDYGVRAIAQVRDDRKKLDHVFSSIFRMQFLVAAFVLVLWFIYVFCIAGEEKIIALHLSWMSVSCLINLDWCLMGLGSFKPIALRNTAVKLLAAICVFLFVKSPNDLWIYGFVWSLSTLVGCLLCIPSLRGRVRLVSVPFNDVLKHLKPCTLLLVSVLAVRVYRTMDKVMVGAIAGMSENGLYENAEKIIYCLSGFISAIGTVLMPKVSHMQANGETQKIRMHIETSMHLVLCMTSAMAFGLASIAREFAPLFFGNSFAASGTLMIPLAFTLIMIGFANVIRTQWILPQQRDFIVLRSVTSGAVINLIMNALLIPKLGAFGAVIGTLAAELAVPTIQFLHLRKELPYKRFLDILAVYAVIGFIMLAAVRLLWLLPVSGWLSIAVSACAGAVLYMLLCLTYWKKTKQMELLRLIRLH